VVTPVTERVTAARRGVSAARVRENMTAVEGAALILPDGREVRLAGELTIGRDDGNALVLNHPTVSRSHASLTEREGRWYIADRGSFNGTFINDDRIPPGIALQLRHADRVGIGSQVLLFSSPTQRDDPERTEPLEEVRVGLRGQLSPFQKQVVQCLCGPWLAGGSLDELPSNEAIAAMLGTPGAVGAVKAALRRSYAKAGLTGGPVYAKRRALCRIARQRGWI
jgi:pSer/pThr/pTyr-binding forkhead associated (FHA) protein